MQPIDPRTAGMNMAAAPEDFASVLRRHGVLNSPTSPGLNIAQPQSGGPALVAPEATTILAFKFADGVLVAGDRLHVLLNTVIDPGGGLPEGGDFGSPQAFGRFGQHPIGLLDVKGYYEPLMAFLDRTVAAGFVNETQMAMVTRQSDVETLLDGLQAAADAARPSADLDRI